MNKKLFISGLLAIVLSCNNALCDENKFGKMLLYYTAIGDNPKIKYFIQNGANPNHEDDDGKTPLFFAVWKDNLNIVKYLIHNGANPNHKDNAGETPLSSFDVRGELREYLQRIRNFSKLPKQNKIRFILDNLDQPWIKDILSFAFATSMLEFNKNPRAGLNSTLFGQLFKQVRKENKLKKFIDTLQKTFKKVQINTSDSLYMVITKILDKTDIAVTKTKKFRDLLKKEQLRLKDFLIRIQYLLEEL